MVRIALAVLLVTPAAQAAPVRTFSVPEAKRAFHAETGVRLVNFRAASTPDAASLTTKAVQDEALRHVPALRPQPAQACADAPRVHVGVKPDSRGIHWVSDRAGGWIAVAVYARNLLIAWIPPHGTRGIDASWTRLD